MKSMFVWPIQRAILALATRRFGNVEDHVGHEDRRIHARGHADPEGDGESPELLVAKPVEHGRGDQVCQVAVHDRGAGPMEGVAYRHPQRGPPVLLLASRSNTSTLLSTAMPTVSARPTSPVSVKATFKVNITPKNRIRVFRAPGQWPPAAVPVVHQHEGGTAPRR